MHVLQKSNNIRLVAFLLETYLKHMNLLLVLNVE